MNTLNANIIILLSNQPISTQRFYAVTEWHLVFQFNSWFCSMHLAPCVSLHVSCLSIIKPFFSGQVGHDIDTRTFVRHIDLIWAIRQMSVSRCRTQVRLVDVCPNFVIDLTKGTYITSNVLVISAQLFWHLAIFSGTFSVIFEKFIIF